MLRVSNPIAAQQWYIYEIDGHRYKSTSPGVLYAECQTKGEKRSYQDWYDLMIHKMCLELPPGSCMGDIGEDKYVKTLRWEDIIGFTQAVIAVAKTKAAGQPIYVGQAEADRRSLICSECKYNAEVSCRGCHGIINLAQRFLQSRMAVNQAKLGACKLCGCWLGAKIWVSREVLSRIIKKDFEYPEECWNNE